MEHRRNVLGKRGFTASGKGAASRLGERGKEKGERGKEEKDNASTKLGLCSNIHDSPLQITYHRFLKLIYTDAAETKKAGYIMLNELIRDSPETPDGHQGHRFPGPH